jgi:threonine dehydrogenase-like Zn-dependent dehydrogenase
MKALQMTDSIPRYAASMALAKVRDGVFWGPLACLRYREVDPPALPNDEWARVRTIYGGICGSDIGTITLHASTSTTVFTSFPFTLGHENVGRISERGASVDGFQVGDRVVVDPLLSYETRGLPVPDDRELNLCDAFDRGTIAPGMLTGFCADTGGSWSEEFVAHRSQLM